jgi:hypothetical protein
MLETREAAEALLTFSRRPGHTVREVVEVDSADPAEFVWLEYLFRFDASHRKHFRPVGDRHLLHCVWELTVEALSDPNFLSHQPGPENRARKKRGGRPVDTDKRLQKRIVEAWDTGRYKRYADLARELGLDEKTVELAIDRDRKPTKQT